MGKTKSIPLKDLSTKLSQFDEDDVETIMTKYEGRESELTKLTDDLENKERYGEMLVIKSEAGQFAGMHSAEVRGAFSKIQAQLPGGVLRDILPGELFKHRNYHCNGTDFVAANGKAYLAPCEASRVLCFDIESGTASFIGDENLMRKGGDKYSATVLGGDGKLYGIPAAASNVLCIDPVTHTVSFLDGDLGKGNWKWHGGVRAKDGRIFGMPCGADTVLCIDPRKGIIMTFGEKILKNGIDGHCLGGVLAPCNGKIYGFPFNARQMLCIDPETMSTSFVGAHLDRGGEKYIGGCCSRDGMLIGTPSCASQVLLFDPKTTCTTLIGKKIAGDVEYKYSSCMLAPDGKVYCAPCCARRVLVIDTATQGVTTMGDDLGNGEWKWWGCCMAKDGCIVRSAYFCHTATPPFPCFAVPHCAERVLDELLAITPPSATASKSETSDFSSLSKEEHDTQESGTATDGKECRDLDGEFQMGPKDKRRYTGCVYTKDLLFAVPGQHAEGFLCVDLKKKTQVLIGQHLFEENPGLVGNQDGEAYTDAIVAHNGTIYCIPCCATRVACIDPVTKRVWLIGEHLGDEMWKWRGAVLASNDKIYCAADSDHPGKMLCIDTKSNKITLYDGKGTDGKDTGVKTMGGYCGAFEGKGEDGKSKIFCMPFWRVPYSVLVFDPETEEAEELPVPMKIVGKNGGHKWRGGVAGLDKVIYCIPHGSARVLTFDPKAYFETPTECMGTIGCDLDRLGREGYFPWMNGARGSDGLIYAAPVEGGVGMLVINPALKTVYTVPVPMSKTPTKGRSVGWYGIAAPSDSTVMYAMPHQWSGSSVLTIAPPTAVMSAYVKEAEALNLTDRKAFFKYCLDYTPGALLSRGGSGDDKEAYASRRSLDFLRVLAVLVATPAGVLIVENILHHNDLNTGESNKDVPHTSTSRRARLRVASSYNHALSRIRAPKISKGDRVKIVKIGSHEGEFGIVTVPDWDGRVKLEMVDSAEIKSYKRSEIELVDFWVSHADPEGSVCPVQRNNSVVLELLDAVVCSSSLVEQDPNEGARIAFAATLHSVPGLVEHVDTLIASDSNPTLSSFLSQPAVRSMLSRKQPAKNDEVVFETMPFSQWLVDQLELGHECNTQREIGVPPATIEHLHQLSKVVESFQKRNKPVGAFVSEFAAIDNLVNTIFGVHGRTREKILEIPLIRMALAHPSTHDKDWLSDRCLKPEEFAGTYAYLRFVSAPENWMFDGADYDQFYINLSKHSRLLPAMVGMRSSRARKLASTRVMMSILDLKMREPHVMCTLLFDGIALIVVTVCFWVGSSVHDSEGKGAERIPIDISDETKHRLKIVVLAFTVFMIVREAMQAVAMCKAKLFDVYVCDSKNILDVLVYAGLSYCTTGDWQPGPGAREPNSVVTAFVSLLLSVKLLTFLKGLNVHFAKFVLCIPNILYNMLPFLVVMAMLMIGFAHAFHILEHDDDPETFGTFGLSLFHVYQMMLGEFPDEFPRPVTSFLFILFTLLIMIVMLNVLIAVVSDGYDGAALKAKQLFFQGKLELVAELDLLFSLNGGMKRSASRLLGPLTPVMSFLLGQKQSTDSDAPPGAHDDEDNWDGRMVHFEKQHQRNAEKFRKHMSEQMDALTKQVTQRIEEQAEQTERMAKKMAAQQLQAVTASQLQTQLQLQALQKSLQNPSPGHNWFS
jgi:hypothetical protein